MTACFELNLTQECSSLVTSATFCLRTSCCTRSVTWYPPPGHDRWCLRQQPTYQTSEGCAHWASNTHRLCWVPHQYAKAVLTSSHHPHLLGWPHQQDSCEGRRAQCCSTLVTHHQLTTVSTDLTGSAPLAQSIAAMLQHASPVPTQKH
jgi:hypothetical protein